MGQYQYEVPEIDQIDADSISELATTDNCVSTWYIDDPKDINKAVLALTSGFRNLDSIQLVVFNIKDLDQYGLTAKKSEETAFTKAVGYKKYHYDIIDLNHRKLGHLAQLIMRTLHNDGIVNVDKMHIVEVLSRAMVDKVVDFEKLDKNLKAGLVATIMKDLKSKNSKLAPIISEPIKEKLQQQIEKNKRKTNCPHEPMCLHWKGA